MSTILCQEATARLHIHDVLQQVIVINHAPTEPSHRHLMALDLLSIVQKLKPRDQHVLFALNICHHSQLQYPCHSFQAWRAYPSQDTSVVAEYFPIQMFDGLGSTLPPRFRVHTVVCQHRPKFFHSAGVKAACFEQRLRTLDTCDGYSPKPAGGTGVTAGSWS